MKQLLKYLEEQRNNKQGEKQNEQRRKKNGKSKFGKRNGERWAYMRQDEKEIRDKENNIEWEKEKRGEKMKGEEI